MIVRSVLGFRILPACVVGGWLVLGVATLATPQRLYARPRRRRHVWETLGRCDLALIGALAVSPSQFLVLAPVRSPKVVSRALVIGSPARSPP